MQFRTVRVPFGDVDAITEEKLAIRFSIEYYPTVIFFIAGRAIKYDGERTSSDIVDWIEK